MDFILCLLTRPLFWAIFTCAVLLVIVLRCLLCRRRCKRPCKKRKRCVAKPVAASAQTVIPPPSVTRLPPKTRAPFVSPQPYVPPQTFAQPQQYVQPQAVVSPQTYVQPQQYELPSDGGIERLLNELGYAYERRQNIFYSVQNAWQRAYGYCSLYDESAPVCGIITDSEVIYFEYNGTRYLIELWKGQYGITTGCEVGFYRDTGRTVLGSPFFECVSDAEMLDMSVSLVQNGTLMFARRDRHWWLTGFRLGEFARPEELAAVVRIVFPDCTAMASFMRALRALGYAENEAFNQGTAVTVYFDKPKTPQPSTRGGVLEETSLAASKLMVNAYRMFADGRGDTLEVLTDARERLPHVYDAAVKLSSREDAYVRLTKGKPLKFD